MSLIGQSEDYLSDSWKNAKTNLGRTYSNFANGNILSGINDIHKLGNNATGNWGSQANINHPLPQFQPDKHLGTPNENGVMPLNDDGKSFLDQHMQQVAPVQSEQPTSQMAPMNDGAGKKGLIGRAFDDYLGGQEKGIYSSMF
jgi:hypothetical protein